jgi:hypothetical protein
VRVHFSPTGGESEAEMSVAAAVFGCMQEAQGDLSLYYNYCARSVTGKSSDATSHLIAA